MWIKNVMKKNAFKKFLLLLLFLDLDETFSIYSEIWNIFQNCDLSETFSKLVSISKIINKYEHLTYHFNLISNYKNYFLIFCIFYLKSFINLLTSVKSIKKFYPHSWKFEQFRKITKSISFFQFKYNQKFTNWYEKYARCF